LSSSGAWNAEHRIVLDDVVGTLEHEFHAAEVAKGAPATMDVGPIKQLEPIRIDDRLTCPTANVLLLLAGVILAPGRRTVTAAPRILRRDRDHNFCTFHRIFNRAAVRI
jgi:hypothetical protein